jgi:hypothetical protein
LPRTLAARPVNGRIAPKVPTMHTAATFGVAVLQLDEPRAVHPVCGPPPRNAGDPAPVIMRQAQDHLRIAGGIHEMVVHRLFSAGLTLETALGLMGDHPVAGRIQAAISELDLAIQDYRTALFDHHRP